MNFNIYNIDEPKFFTKTTKILNSARLITAATSIAMAGLGAGMLFTGSTVLSLIPITLFIVMFATTLMLTKIQQQLIIEAKSIEAVISPATEDIIKKEIHDIKEELSATKNDFKKLCLEVKSTQDQVKDLSVSLQESLMSIHVQLEESNVEEIKHICNEVISVKSNVIKLNEVVSSIMLYQEESLIEFNERELEVVLKEAELYNATEEQLEMLQDLKVFIIENRDELDMLQFKEELMELKRAIRDNKPSDVA